MKHASWRSLRSKRMVVSEWDTGFPLVVFRGCVVEYLPVALVFPMREGLRRLELVL